mgnify:CR=1 FL=1
MKSRKKLYIVTVFILILIFVLSLLIETLFLKSLTEDDYNSLIDYSDYIVRTTYLKEEDVQTQNWNYINNIKVVIKNNFDDDEEEKSRKSTIEISLSLPKQYQELTVTYPYILDTNKNELIITNSSVINGIGSWCHQIEIFSAATFALVWEGPN